MTSQINGHTFESGCDVIDVTSMHRPDITWRFVDAAGHDHRWCVHGAPADRYDPTATYDTPTLITVSDGWGIDADDGESVEWTHMECRECGEKITRGYTADEYQQYMPGLRWCRIDGVTVSREEFERRYLEETTA